MKKLKTNILYQKRKFYHIYNRGNHKNKIFIDEKDYHQFVSIVKRYEKMFDIIVFSYCLMPNHYHLILRLGDNKTDITRFMHRCMTSYVMYFNRKYGFVGSLCQGNFQARIVKGSMDLSGLIDYLKNNPIEAGLVSKEGKYKWLYLKKIEPRLDPIPEKGQTSRSDPYS